MARTQHGTVLCQICKQEKRINEVMPGELVRPSVAESIRKKYPDPPAPLEHPARRTAVMYGLISGCRSWVGFQVGAEKLLFLRGLLYEF